MGQTGHQIVQEARDKLQAKLALSAFLLEEFNVDDWQNSCCVQDKEHDKPIQLVVLGSFPHTNALPD